MLDRNLQEPGWPVNGALHGPSAHPRSRELRSLTGGLVRSVIAALLGLTLVTAGGCAKGPSRSAIEDAVTADLRMQLAQLGNSPFAQLTGEARELKELAASEQLRVEVADQKCNPIGEDKFRCDVLLDLHRVQAQLPAGARESATDGGADSEKQAVYVLTKLGGKWRAQEESR
jgi:hypothetical protein